MRRQPSRLRTFALATGAAFVLLATPRSEPPSAGAREVATVELPTEWHLSKPPGSVATTGTLPESATFTADGAHVVVTNAGDGPAQIQISNAASLTLERTIPMKGAYGAPLPDLRGSGFWASTAGESSLVHLDAATGATDRTIALAPGTWASAIARSPDGTTLAVADERGGTVQFVDLASGAVAATPPFGKHLADVRYAPDGKNVFAASWGGASLFEIGAASRQVVREIAVGRHPEHLVFSPDGTKLYVAEPDEDDVAVVDPASGAVAKRIPIDLYDGAIGGISPTSLALDPSGTRLYVTCSAANAVAVLAPAGTHGDPTATFVGAIPTGWYPTDVALDPSGRSLLVADGMGERSRANPQYRPFERRSPANTGYVAASMAGSVRRIPIPDDAALARNVATIRANGGPYLAASLADPGTLAHGPAIAGVGATILRPGGPIRHVVYIIKENRTYDQILGDLPEGDGDPSLTLFGRGVTPNQHAISERFGLFDATFADAEVSADGHNWSTAAFANDYLERMWPQNYAGRRDGYDFEDGASASVPHGGYLWNLAKRSGVSLRNYGEFTSEPDERQPVAGEQASSVHAGITSSMPDLAEETNHDYPGFDLAVSDLTRIAIWKREYDAETAAGTLPAIEIVRLPNDHTNGTRAGRPTPSAYVAQNDDALGRLVDVVSHSKNWSSTAIFALEDDAQNGADHVDDQRMTFYLASPYAAGGVRHEHYSTAGVLRTIEMIFGMPPMSAYDAAARPLTAAFTDRPNLAPFDALPETQSETATNAATAYHARENLRYDLTHEDAFPAAEMNDEIWHAVTGHAAPAAYAPRRAPRARRVRRTGAA